MGFVDGLKSLGCHCMSGFLLKYLSDASDEKIVKLLKYAEKFPRYQYEDIHEGVAYIAKVCEEGHPAMQVIKRIITQVHPKVRRKILENWLINSFFLGANKRDDYTREYGCYPPTLMVISPTMRCNLNCYGCYASEYTKKDSDLSYELVDRIFTEAKNIGIHFIVVSGGEPFVRKDLLDLYEKHSDIGFQIYTNGSLIDQPTVERLAELGNVMPCISIEGFEKETDERRGKGHFNTIMDTMDRMREAGMVFGFSVTSTRHNTDIIISDEFMAMLVEKGATLGWYFTYIPIGRNPDISLMQTPEQRDKQRQRVSELRNNYPILLADFWNDGWLTNGCICAGERYFHINAHGDVEPCVFVHYAMDNIKEKPLAEALNSPLFRKMRDRRPYCKNPLRPCTLIDVPEISREGFNTPGVYATHPGAEVLFTELVDYIDEYTAEYGKLADKAWEEHPSLKPVRKVKSKIGEKESEALLNVEVVAGGE
ncbi:radical SAM protein [Candidatus Poribacteria bacterium]|nr:radical SAM protein [Candidatus Poribacteria bacterium]